MATLIIRELRNSYGKTILPAEQNGRKALDIGDKTILLVSGRTACDRNAQAL
ncbi:MAG: hypothetical protein QW470_03735 [Candidatus Caldarchaeum sp.]